MKWCCLVLALVSVTYAAPRANDLNKAVTFEDNEIPVKKAKAVSAQWGGFRAGAGLEGSENGGALFAGAEGPGLNAGAGLAGGSAESGARCFSCNGHTQGGGFFDRVFAIPINVLHSVNSYVKTKKHGHVAPGHAGAGSVGAGAGAGAGASAGAGAADSPPKSGGADASSASASASVEESHSYHKHPDYDKIFNIPISALKSVNDLLNG